jgi:hypothetical protein
LGSNLRVQPDHVQTFLQNILADPDIPTKAERAQACEQAKNEYLAVMYLVNSNRQYYGSLIRGIKNEYTQGSDTYPTTLNAVYNYIANYQPAKGSRTKNR